MKNIFLILLISINLFAWEVSTHRAIDQKALGHTPNLDTFISDSGVSNVSYEDETFDGYDMTDFKYIREGEKNGMAAEELKQIFPDAYYQSLIEAGTILEDAQWPHWFNAGPWDRIDGRFQNHFADPQNNYGGLLGKSSAPLWAW